MRQLTMEFRPVRFYLGSHQPQWLGRTDTPLFVSDARLRERKALPRACSGWALDSGAFSQLHAQGEWPAGSARAYAERIRRYADEIGSLEWAAPQDWMCEPFMVERTGLSIAEHQARTVGNYAELASMALPVVPVIQGYHATEYLDCIERYARTGIDLNAAPLVGVGTICRRQGMREAQDVLRAIRMRLPSPRLHCFGVKIAGLHLLAPYIDSADSMAWSYHARRRPAMPGHTHKNCANCLDFAEAWYKRLPVSLAGAQSVGVRRSAGAA